MAKLVEGLKYAESHEWVKVEGDLALIGITDYAQHALGNITYVDMPSEGDEVNAGEEFDSSKVDYSYYNQAVISISNENGGQGTGFIITNDGLCLTCAHCICTDGSMQKARLTVMKTIFLTEWNLA